MGRAAEVFVLWLLLLPLGLAKPPPQEALKQASWINAGAPLAAIRGDGGIFYHRDAVGSVVAVSAADSATQDFLPFGLPLGAVIADVAFGGHRVEEATSALHAQARLLQPAIGRFDSSDPVTRPAQSGYAFVRNAPLRFVDPDGRLELDVRPDLVYAREASHNPVIIYLNEPTYQKVLETGRWGAEGAEAVYVAKYKMSFEDAQREIFQVDPHDAGGPQRLRHQGKGQYYVMIDAEGLELAPGKNKFDIIHEGPIDLHGRVLSAGTNEFAPLSAHEGVGAARLNHHAVSARYRAPLDLPNRPSGSITLRSVGVGLLFAYPNVRDGISLMREGEWLDGIDQFLMIFSPVFMVNPASWEQDPHNPLSRQGPKN